MSARFVFKETEKTRAPGEKSLGERERTNNKLNPHNYGVDAGNWKRATFVGGEFSHHCNAVAPRWLKHCRLFHDVTKSHRLFDEFIFFQIQVLLWRSLLNGRSPVQFLKVLQLLMSLRPRPNVKTFTRSVNQTLWVKFMKSSTSGSVKVAWMSLDRPTRNVWRSSPENLNLNLHTRRTKLINLKFVW